MRKSLIARLAHLFITIMVLASICSFIVMILIFNNSFLNEIQEVQNSIAVTMIELDQKTDFDLDKIIKIAANSRYSVFKINDITSLHLSDEDQYKLEVNRILYTHGKYIPIGRTLVMIEDNIVLIGNHPQNNTIRNTILRIVLTLLFAIIIGTIILVPIGKREFQPIYKLNTATKEVAKGNFDVQIKSTAQGELGELTESFNKMAHELKGMEIFRRDFISNVSHEFKTPIASIQGFAKILQTGDLPEGEKREYTDIIVQESNRLSKLSTNILKLSKLENQEIILEQTYFSLDEQIRRVILILESHWEEKNISFNMELEDIKFYGNEELLQQVWLNLLENAIKFSNEGGEITVKLYDAGSKAIVKVIDDGIGMTEEIQKRVFEQFYQADKARSSEGNGLGLPLVKRIVDLCGGCIRVKSKLSGGSIFTVELPKLGN